jgi:hypothetical protein
MLVAFNADTNFEAVIANAKGQRPLTFVTLKMGNLTYRFNYVAAYVPTGRW